MVGTEECNPIGIDLGTTYSCVAVWHHDHIEIIVNDQGYTTTPPQIAFTDIDSLVGEAASYQAMKSPINSIFDSKRLIVITVPVYFNDSQRQATKDAGITAGLNVKKHSQGTNCFSHCLWP
ncbi:hypothetical protein M0R45_015156 [Rubus argutus]|uniref:Uncharacterized protein n=1 Tax=Rubus argutus TaxID=59490 RepID=A0AAW1XRA6_RUBAR